MLLLNRISRNVYMEKVWTWRKVLSKNLQSSSASDVEYNKSLKLDKRYDDIADYYTNKSVFITGGTGFLGKVLIEKLLYSCPNIDKIYVLTRVKNNMTAHQRFHKYFESPLFERLRNERPQDLNKVIPIQGDTTHEELGVSKESKSKLLENVSIVINASAKIDLADPLETSMKHNYEPTKSIINFCRRMKSLKVFVHVSTAYSNCDKHIIEEKVYSPPADMKDVHNHLKKYGNNHLSKILNGQPNTYTFAKAMLESYIKENPINNVHTFIIRPSVVIAKAESPCVGWIDDWQAVSIITYGVTSGWFRFMNGNANNIVDFIPVDYVANLITVLPTTTNKINSNNMLSVYNCTSSSCNPVTFKSAMSLFISEALRQGYVELPFPMFVTFNSKMLVDVLTLIHIVPAFVGDLVRRTKGQLPKYIKLLKSLNKIRNGLEFFVKRSWEFKSDNAGELYKTLTPAQQKLYPFDAKLIEWRQYLPKCYEGMIRYLPKKRDM